MGLRVLTINDVAEWERVLSLLPSADVYYTPEYLSLYTESSKVDSSFCGEPILFYYGDDACFVIEAFLKRRINAKTMPFISIGEEYYDLITPYGYGGPLASTGADKEFIAAYFNAVAEYCQNHKIITSFVRFHPLLGNHELIPDVFPVDVRNTTVSLDLTKEWGVIWGEMDKKTRNLVRKAQRSAISIVRMDDDSHYRQFIDLYLQTMKRRNAQQLYFFPDSYFLEIRKLLGNHISLFVALYQGRVIAGALFFHYGKYLHYHLSGSDEQFFSLAPNNLLLAEAIRWGQTEGFKMVHLGGGYGGKNDSLFHFKSGFSPLRRQFYTMNRIYDPNIYKQLCSLKMDYEGKIGVQVQNEGYFPFYRR